MSRNSPVADRVRNKIRAGMPYPRYGVTFAAGIESRIADQVWDVGHLVSDQVEEQL